MLLVSVSLSSSALSWTVSCSICKHLSSFLAGFFLVHPCPNISLPSLPCLDFLSLTTLSYNYSSLRLFRSLSRFFFSSMLGLGCNLQVIYFSKTKQVTSSCVGGRERDCFHSVVFWSSQNKWEHLEAECTCQWNCFMTGGGVAFQFVDIAFCMKNICTTFAVKCSPLPDLDAEGTHTRNETHHFI